MMRKREMTPSDEEKKEKTVRQFTYICRCLTLHEK